MKNPNDELERSASVVYVEAGDEIKLPTYASDLSAGLDVYLPESVVLRPAEKKILKTGIKLAIPPDMELQVRPRSGLSYKTNLKISNSPGTIDADYRDEIGIILENSFRMTDLLDQLLLDPGLKERLVKDYRICDYSDYTGFEVNTPLDLYVDSQGNPYGTVYLEKGERIAQLVLSKYCRLEFTRVSAVKDYGSNRGGGFGSTGR